MTKQSIFVTLCNENDPPLTSMVISLGTSRKILQQVISQLFSQEGLHSQEKRTCNFQDDVDSLIKIKIKGYGLNSCLIQIFY